MSLEDFIKEQRRHLRPIVCVQGIGFVGVAMMAAVAQGNGQLRYGVVGKDIESQRPKIKAILSGRSPVRSGDQHLESALNTGINRRNLYATAEPAILRETEILLMCLPVDYDHQSGEVDLQVLLDAVREANQFLPDGALVIVLSTVPPGTCQGLVRPLLRHSIDLAHSYERVTPGVRYLESVTEAKRVYAGATPHAARRCRDFWTNVIAPGDDQLTELSSMTSSETAKVLENSYRAVNIAFVQEWARYCEGIGIDFEEIGAAVRLRPSHANLLHPRVGVGGYCLTKDPVLAAATNAPFSWTLEEFPFCDLAIRTNQETPKKVAEWFDAQMGGVRGKRIHVLGYSYAPNVGDVRHSPAKRFIKSIEALGAIVDWSDPFVDSDTAEQGKVETPASLSNYDIVFVAVAHDLYADVGFWRRRATPSLVVVDGSGAVAGLQNLFIELGIPLFRVGAGVRRAAHVASQG